MSSCKTVEDRTRSIKWKAEALTEKQLTKRIRLIFFSRVVAFLIGVGYFYYDWQVPGMGTHVSVWAVMVAFVLCYCYALCMDESIGRGYRTRLKRLQYRKTHKKFNAVQSKLITE